MGEAAQVISDANIRHYQERQTLEIAYKKQQIIRNEFLREQILEHDRIDLLMKEVLGYDVVDFHLLLYYHRKAKAKKIDKQRWHLAIAPRGGGKTTIMTISSIILDILKRPKIRILIASKTDSNAVEMLSEIKNKLESKRLVEIFGEQVGKIWNDGEITVKGRDEDQFAPKGKTVATLGIGSAIASRHFDKIYADDLIDEANSNTELQREKIYNWFFKVLDPTLVPKGQMSIIGTRYHHEDLYGTLIEELFEKRKRGKLVRKHWINIPALIRKKNHRRFKKRKDKYISFWPERFSVKFLLGKKKNQGTIIFNSQMQGDVEGMKGKIFKYDWFKFVRTEDIPIRELKIYQGVDLAIKQKENADKFAHVTIGVHPKTKRIYVLNYYNSVTHYTKQKKLIYDRYLKYDPIKVGIEANGYQLALLQDMSDNKDLAEVPTFPLYTETDKTVRAWKLSAIFERGDVLLTEGMNELLQHLLKMPDGRYKDLFDALDMAIRIAFNRRGRVRNSEPGVM